MYVSKQECPKHTLNKACSKYLCTTEYHIPDRVTRVSYKCSMCQSHQATNNVTEYVIIALTVLVSEDVCITGGRLLQRGHDILSLEALVLLRAGPSATAISRLALYHQGYDLQHTVHDV